MPDVVGCRAFSGTCSAWLLMSVAVVAPIGALDGVGSPRIGGIRNISITSQLAGGDRTVEHIRRMHKVMRARKRGYSVLDVGAAANPWALQLGIVDAVLDFDTSEILDCWGDWDLNSGIARSCCKYGDSFSLFVVDDRLPKGAEVGCFTQQFNRIRCCREEEPIGRLQRFHFDITSPAAWQPLYEHVEQHGRFDFAICSHVLEDVLDPRVVADALPRIAKAGIVRVPTKYHEFERGRENMSDLGVSPYRGSIHHRYVYTIRDGEMLAVPKLPFMEVDPVYDILGEMSRRDNADLNFLWQGSLPFQILNNGYIGPSVEAVVKQTRAVLGPDVVDDVIEVMASRVEGTKT
mmetsp:Transcript_17143/g.55364  ORF Transcript_17143/g.55364 Transcript_17143/m.55364 type:complete len:348 (+) Transcript_17143:31-1074(+)